MTYSAAQVENQAALLRILAQIASEHPGLPVNAAFAWALQRFQNGVDLKETA